MNDTNVAPVKPKKEINYQYKILYAIGIIYVLIQRIKEINGGEEYDARNY